MRLLVVSPIASHPQNQGNSARIHALCRGLQAMGHQVHFLYYPMEGLTPQQHESMISCWDGFHSIPCEVRIPPPRPGLGYAIDDWYDPALGRFASALHAHWHFDAVIVNYVWISGVLAALPDDLVKIIDTHDVFGGRASIFESVGLEPEWYHTTPAEERKGLARADVVLAIQSLEAGHFRALCEGLRTRVFTLGHGAATRFLPPRANVTRPVVGYLGSGNPFNLRSVREFAQQVMLVPGLRDQFRFVLAGSICDRFAKAPQPFESIGLIDELHDFYCEVDLVLNPMLGGTGLKIKTLEALSFGLPLLGTEDAWAGIAPTSLAWPAGPVASLAAALQSIADEPALLLAMRQRCQRIYTDYLATQLGALHELFDPSELRRARRTPLPH